MPIYEPVILESLRSVGKDRPAAEELPTVLLGRRKLLDDEERLLLELNLQRHLSNRQIGKLVEQPFGTVSRRLRRIKAKLSDPMAAALADPGCRLGTIHRDLAVGHYFRAESARSLAEKHGLSLFEVRMRLQYVRGWVKGRRDGWLARARLEERAVEKRERQV